MGTKFSIKDPNPGVWFKFDDNDPESGEIRIRSINHDRRQEIQRKCIKKKVEYKHGQRFEYQDTDDDLFSQMIWDYSIAEWAKLEDDDGKELPCDLDTKVFLMKNNVGFAQFVGQCLDQLNDDEENRVARLKKNLSNGSNGSGESQTVKSVKS